MDPEIEEELRKAIGGLFMNNIMLAGFVKKLQAEIASLKSPAPDDVALKANGGDPHPPPP